MRESPGKRVAREVFFLDCLGQWFTPEERQAGSYLGLLGAEPVELDYLDILGFQRGNIRSVECDLVTYEIQRGWNAGVSLWYGLINTYLRDLLHADEASIVVNADIEGGFLANLDASMTSVILYCWLRPQTALATYSTVGRDAKTLCEGLKSLLALMWIDAEATEWLVSGLYQVYASRTENPLRMVLRDLFWIRSMVENTMLASVWVDVTRFESMRGFLAVEAQLWEMLKTETTGDLTLADIRHIVTSANRQGGVRRVRTEPRLGLWIAELETVLYKAQPPFSHRCYFARTEWLRGGIDLVGWYKGLVTAFLDHRLVYADRAGGREDPLIEAGRPALPDEEPVFARADFIDHRPRILSVRRPDTAFYDTVQRLRQRYHTLVASSPVSPPRLIRKEVTESMPTPQIQWLEDGQLTAAGKEQIKDYGRRGLELTAAEIHKLLPEHVRRVVPVTSVTAYIAIARRGLSRNGHASGQS